jgi:hypothetical protein
VALPNQSIIVNFEKLGNPTQLAYFFTPTAGSTISGSSVATYKIGNTILGTGLVSWNNGTYSVYGSTMQMIWSFNTDWNSYNYTGVQRVNVTWGDDLSKAYPRPATRKDYGAGTDYYAGMGCADGPTSFAGGHYFYLSSVNIHAIAQITNLSTSNSLMPFTFNITKTGISQYKVYNNDSSLYFTGVFDNQPDEFLGFGGNIIVSVFVPASSHIFNSTVFFPFINPVAIPTPKVTLTPNITSYTVDDAYISIEDSITSGVIPNSQYSVYSQYNGNWTNGTTSTGLVHYHGMQHDFVDVYASKTGYISNSKKNLVINGVDYKISLIPINGSVHTAQTYLETLVTDFTDGATLENARVTIENDTMATAMGYTNSGGYYEFIIPDLGYPRLVKITASKNNYYTFTKYQIINGSMDETFIELQRKTTAPTATYTQPTIPYTTIQTIPVITPKAWTNDSVAVCGVVADNRSIVDYFKSQLACNGFKDGISQSLVLAGIIILLCLGAGAKYGKGIGAAIGAIIGFVLAFALGVIPFMVVALIITLLILFGAILMLSRSR